MCPCLSDADACFVFRHLAQVSHDPLQQVYSALYNPPLASSFDTMQPQSHPLHLLRGVFKIAPTLLVMGAVTQNVIVAQLIPRAVHKPVQIRQVCDSDVCRIHNLVQHYPARKLDMILSQTILNFLVNMQEIIALIGLISLISCPRT